MSEEEKDLSREAREETEPGRDAAREEREKARRTDPGRETAETSAPDAPEGGNREEKTREGRETVTVDISRGIEALENRLTEKTSALERAEKDLRQAKDAHIRTLAEYDNFRKRARKEKNDSFQSGLIQAVTGILPIIDTLEMAMAAPCSDANFKKGVEMTLTAARTALKNLGVEEIEAVGKPFDPNLHSAVMQERAEGLEPGIVTRRLQKGYKMGDKVIRHTAVAVSA